MSLYQTVKSAITVRQVGEMYGMEPDRHGMVCCPFHSDSDPSMKLNDTYYYCFGCGANGDAIDLTAKLFDLNPRQAAEKLASDFGLDPDKPPANAIALPPPKRGLTDEQWADIAYCLRVLTDYLDLLHDWRERYKPASPEEPLDERFVEALHMTETIEHLTDCVAFGTPHPPLHPEPAVGHSAAEPGGGKAPRGRDLRLCHLRHRLFQGQQPPCGGQPLRQVHGRRIYQVV